MELTYDQKHTYQFICNSKGSCICCNLITTTDFYGDKNYMASTNKSEQVPFEKMKEYIKDLKEE